MQFPPQVFTADTRDYKLRPLRSNNPFKTQRLEKFLLDHLDAFLGGVHRGAWRAPLTLGEAVEEEEDLFRWEWRLFPIYLLFRHKQKRRVVVACFDPFQGNTILHVRPVFLSQFRLRVTQEETVDGWSFRCVDGEKVKRRNYVSL